MCPHWAQSFYTSFLWDWQQSRLSYASGQAGILFKFLKVTLLLSCLASDRGRGRHRQEPTPLTLPCNTWPSLCLTLALYPRTFSFPKNISFWLHTQSQFCFRAITRFSMLPWLPNVNTDKCERHKWILGNIYYYFLGHTQWMMWVICGFLGSFWASFMAMKLADE